MTDLGLNPSSEHRAWRSSAPFRRLTSLSVRRIAATLIAAGLLALLTVLLASPFSRPRAQLVVFEPPQYAPSQAPAISGGPALAGSFAPLAGVLYQQTDHNGPILLHNLATVTQARTLQQDLSRVLAPEIDVAIFYLAAHGVSQGDSAFLLCGDFDPATNHLGLYLLTDLLSQLRDCPAKLKLLILDAGRIDHDPRIGLVLNEFPRLLADEVRRVGDPNLWVLTSNQFLERSHVCHADQKSIFQELVVLGLQGAADSDGNHEVDLHELAQYVAADVSAWVREHTAGAESQTPRLIWGGGSGVPPEAARTLLPVPRRLPTATSVAQAATGSKAKAAQSISASKTKLTKAASTAATAKRAATAPLEAARQQSAPALAAPPPAAGESQAATPKSTPPAETPPTTAAGPPDNKPVASATGSAVAAGALQPAAPVAVVRLPTNVPEPAPPLPPPPPVNATVPELLHAAWRLRDALESREGGRPSPVDYAPHLWRQLQDRLLAYEAMYRADRAGSTERLVAALRDEILTLPELLARNVPLELDDRATLAEQIAFLQPQPPAAVNSPRSLALATVLSWSSPALSAARIRELAAQLDFWTNSPPAREEYRKWVAALATTERDLSELRWAVELDALTDLDWPTLQLALRTRILAERAAAAGEVCRPWVKKLVEDADRRRLAGERQLLDRLSISSDQTAAQLQLDAARDAYLRTLDACDLVHSAVQLKNDLVFRAPSYVELCGRCGAQDRLLTASHGDTALLLATLPELDALLSAPDPANLDRLAKLHRQLSALRQRIEVGLQGEFLDVLSRSPTAAGSVWQMEVLLSTSLLSHEQRERLNSAVDAAGRHKFDARPSSIQVPPIVHVVTSQNLATLFKRAELDLGLVSLAGGWEPGGPVDENGPRAAFDGLAAAQRQSQLERSSAPPSELLWNAYRRFGASLGAFYRQLPSDIQNALSGDYLLADPATRAGQIEALARAERQLRVLPGFSAQALDHRSPLASLHAARIYDELLWQRERLLSAASDSPAITLPWFNQSAAAYLEQAARIPEQPIPFEGGGPDIALSGPARTSLADGETHEIVITAANRSAAPIKAWVVLHYDPALLEVTGSPGQQFYRLEQTDDDPAALRTLAPSLTLRASAEQPIPLRIVARPSAVSSARLIVKVVTAEAARSPLPVLRERVRERARPDLDRLDPAADGPSPRPSPGVPGEGAQIARHEIDVTLPGPAGIELLVRGTPGTWRTTDSSVVLQPFPNQITNYVLELANRGAQSKRVRIDLTESSHLDGRGRILASAPEVLLPSGGTPVAIEFPKPAAPPAAAPPAPPPAPTPAPPDLRPVIDQGLLLVITDVALNQSIVKRIEIAPLRPRSYLQPTVSYDPQRGRIDVVVRPKDEALMPPAGSKIQWIAESDLTGRMLLAGDVRSPDYTARLFAVVPPDPQRVVNVYLSADGFPRAFVFRVSCGAGQADIPAEEDLCQARIVAPLPGDVLRAPTATLPIALQIDMPIDAFQHPRDRIEVGIDTNLDRDLEGERTTILTADRQVQVRLNEAGPAGLLGLDARVDDFQLDLDARGLQNARVGVLARAVSHDRSGWSPPVEIVLDGAAPRITAVDVSPRGLVTLGQPLKVSVLVTDEEPSSGISRVEVALDLNRIGEFDPEVKPVPAAAEPGGWWTAPIPTEKVPAGVHPLLVRATDRVGHPSEFTTVLVQIGTPDDVAAQGLQKTSRVTGIALYAGQPQAGMTVTLDEGKFPPVQTDDQGRFNFAAVPAGKHKVAAAGVIRNRTRRADAEFTIAPTATQATTLRLTLQ